MAMSRKDYILIASALRTQYEDSEHSPMSDRAYGVLGSAMEIADALKRDNVKFDREHFLAIVKGDRDIESRPSMYIYA